MVVGHLQHEQVFEDIFIDQCADSFRESKA